MFDNGLKILFRTIQKRFLVFGLNLVGLSTGISCTLFITVYSINELSFDKHFQNHDRIYRVVTEYQTNSSSDLSMAESFLGIATTLKREFSQVEEAVRVFPYTGNIAVQYKSGSSNAFKAENTYRVDKEFFTVFKHSFIDGNQTAFSKPNSIVLTKSLSRKMFGDNSPINKAVLIDDQLYGVVGVINDLPRNSDLYYEALISYDFSLYDDDWGNPAGFTYALLNNGADPVELEAGINKVATQKAFSFFVKEYDMKSNIRISLQPLTTIHFSKPLSGDNPKGNPIYLKVLMTLGVLIFGIVLLNHSNFSTSLYMERVHELSVRKLMGINKSQLVRQFFYESGIVAILTLFISIALFMSFLPTVNLIIDKNLSFLNLLDSNALFILLTVFLLIVFAGNFYPLFYSLKNSTVEGLRGFSNLGNNGLRKILIAGQLTFTTGLVFFAITVHNQINFLKSRDLGFSGNKIIMIPIPEDISGGSQLTGFINDLQKDNSIKDVSLISELSYPGSERLGYQLGWIYNNENRIEATFNQYEVDSMFTNVLDMKFLAGNNFTNQTSGSPQQAIVNQAFVNMAGFKNPENIIGETIHAFDDEIKITGVVADFNYQDFQQTVRPLVIVPIDPTSLESKKTLVGLNSLAGLESIENSYQRLASQQPFEYSFLDERVEKMFEQEQTTGRITEIFSMLAILLAAVGLHSLSSLILTQRTKEIGIRKILGITQGALMALVSKEFLVLSLIAFGISIPVAWTLSQIWLSDYAFKIDIRIITIGVTGLIVLTILIVGILTNVLRSTRINPVDLIRSE